MAEEAGEAREDRPDYSLSAEYFDALYEKNPDPWRFETSPYEREKYATTLASLPRHRYGRALEIGCSIGVLTEKLAEHCDALLAVDISERALEIARARCGARAGIEFAAMAMPGTLPEGDFDLILISEVGYYWSSADLDTMVAYSAERLSPGGSLVLVHWIEGGNDKPLDGNQVHDRFIAEKKFELLRDELRDPYRLSAMRRRD